MKEPEKVFILKHENFVMRRLNVQNSNRWILSQVKLGVFCVCEGKMLF